MTKTSSRCSPGVRGRAVRLGPEREGGHPSRWAAISSVAGEFGCTALRKRVRRAERDAGARPGPSGDERVRLEAPERESREPRQGEPSSAIDGVDGSLRRMLRQRPPWHIEIPGAGAIHPINGASTARRSRPSPGGSRAGARRARRRPNRSSTLRSGRCRTAGPPRMPASRITAIALPTPLRSPRRAPRRGRHRAFGRRRRRQLRRRPRRNRDRPLRDRGRPTTRAPARWSPPRWNGSTGSTPVAVSSRSEPSLPPRPSGAVMHGQRPPPWRRDPRTERPPESPALFKEVGWRADLDIGRRVQPRRGPAPARLSGGLG